MILIQVSVYKTVSRNHRPDAPRQKPPHKPKELQHGFAPKHSRPGKRSNSLLGVPECGFHRLVTEKRGCQVEKPC